MHTAGLGDSQQIAPQSTNIIGRAHRLQVGVQPVHQPWILGGDPGRAAVGVAPLRLNTSDRHHCFARNVDHVAAQRERDRGVIGQSTLAEPMKTMSSVRPASATPAYTREKPIRNGKATESLKSSGAAPVPPSPPSMVMKSTPREPSAIAAARSSQKSIAPIAD